MAPAIQSTPGNSSTTIAKRTATADNQSPCAGEECLARAFCAEDSTANLCMYLPPRRTGKTCKCPPRRSTDNSSPALRRGQQPKTACSAQRTATEDSLLCAEDSTAERGGTANLCMYLPPRRTGKTAVAVLRRAGCLQWSLPGLLSAVLPVGEWGDLPRLKSEHSSISVLSLACFCLGGGLPGMRVAVAVRRSNRMTRRHRW